MAARTDERRRQGGPRHRGGGRASRPVVWLQEHARAALGSLGRLWRSPASTTLTVAVIAIALALPGALWLLLKNTQQATGGWDAGTRISVYLQPGLDGESVDAAASRIAARADVRVIERIDAEQALAEFRQLAGFEQALTALESNPLPAVVVLEPASGTPRTPTALERLARQLQDIEGVDQARLDLEWVERLYALLAVVERGVTLLALLLAAGVLLIVGNTIRLDILNRRDEIEVTKLIGASDAFIRRPFLYGGLWYGLAGAVAAWALLAITRALLAGPVARLASAYGSSFRLDGLTLGETGLLIALGAGLGWIGSWLAVGRHLRAIEPG